MSDYATLTLVKSRLGIADTDTASDAALGVIITAASRAIDRWCKRADNAFTGQTQTRVYDVPETLAGPLRYVKEWGVDEGGGSVISGVGVPTGVTSIIDIEPLLSVTSVATDENADGVFETAWLATDYNLLPINAALDGRPYRQIRTADGGAQQFPVGHQRLQIVGSWGEASLVPNLIQEACILTVNRWFKRMDAPFGVIGDSTMGMMHVTAADPDVIGMLDDAGYVDHWFLA